MRALALGESCVRGSDVYLQVFEGGREARGGAGPGADPLPGEKRLKTRSYKRQACRQALSKTRGKFHSLRPAKGGNARTRR